MSELADLPELMTPRQLADYLGIPVSTIWHWRTDRGRHQGPPAIKVGKRLYFRVEDVGRWIEQRNRT